MITPLDMAIQLSDLFEAADFEGTLVLEIFDNDILPYLKNPLHETDMIGLGKRFSQAIERVRATVNQQGSDKIRNLMDMMKSALITYVQRTHDAKTGREIFHRGIMSGGDTMLTITGATIMANAIAGRHPEQAETLMKGVAARLSGARAMAENSSGAAVSAGAIATVAMNKKKKLIRRQDSIFAEDLNWSDLEGEPDRITKLAEIADSQENQLVESVLVDPITAELVLAVHGSLTPTNRRRYESKPMQEMVEIAHRAVQRGLIQVIYEEGSRVVGSSGARHIEKNTGSGTYVPLGKFSVHKWEQGVDPSLSNIVHHTNDQKKADARAQRLWQKTGDPYIVAHTSYLR